MVILYVLNLHVFVLQLLMVVVVVAHMLGLHGLVLNLVVLYVLVFTRVGLASVDGRCCDCACVGFAWFCS